LRDGVMDLRLTPIGRVLDRFPSLARDLARERGKQVRVELEGMNTGVDKSVVDALGEPMLHLVRNALDHGIETPGERERRGKPPEGRVVIRAIQRGDRVRVEIEDDGAGIDRASILERGRTLGRIGSDEELDDPEILDLVFTPGFSTRASADPLSGRGIGLDVVRQAVRELRGQVEVADAPGGGTRFVLSLPLTLAIASAVLFESHGETFALRSGDVDELLRRPAVERVGGSEFVRHRDALVPLARLPRLFGLPGAHGDRPRYAVVVRQVGRSAAVAADRLADQRDVVIRALPVALAGAPAVAGATVEPGGRVSLLLDPAGIIRLNLASNRRQTPDGRTS
jgi:two-component system, chemotaxis family, sensor kinase CheA